MSDDTLSKPARRAIRKYLLTWAVSGLSFVICANIAAYFAWVRSGVRELAVAEARNAIASSPEIARLRSEAQEAAAGFVRAHGRLEGQLEFVSDLRTGLAEALHQARLDAASLKTAIQRGRAFSDNSAQSVADQLATRAPELWSRVGASLPIGFIAAFPSHVASGEILHGHWMVCDGRALHERDFPLLAEVLQTIFGVGAPAHDEPPGTFNLPDLRGIFLRGADGRAPDATGVDPDRPRRIGSLQPDALQDHTHELTSFVWHSSIAHGGHTGGLKNDPGATPTSPPQGCRTASETRPTNIAVHWLIRVQ